MVPVIEALETHAELATISWPASAARPATFPADLPFMAGHAATMLMVHGSMTVEWEGLPASEVESVAHALVDAGWVETTIPDSSMPGMIIRPFRLCERQRVLIHDGRMLSLLDTRAE